jgi:hypothetical protein
VYLSFLTVGVIPQRSFTSEPLVRIP